MKPTITTSPISQTPIQSPSQPHQSVRVVLRLRELMAEKNIRSVSALHRILIEKRVTVSHSQLLRIVDNRADHWKVDFLSAFLDIFNCEVGQLFKTELSSPSVLN